MTYKTPVKDIRFALDNVADFTAVEKTGAFEDLSGDLVEAILEEMGRFCDEIVAPLNVESDKHGATLADGAVRATPGFREAYAQYVEGGWNALSCPADFGGQDLPTTLAVVLVDARQPMSYTSAQSGDNYRNWWPHPVMTAFTNDSIDELDRLAQDSGLWPQSWCPGPDSNRHVLSDRRF